MSEQETPRNGGWLGLGRDIHRTSGLIGLAFAVLLIAFLWVGKLIVDKILEVSPGAVYAVVQELRKELKNHADNVEDFKWVVDQTRDMVRANCANSAKTQEQLERCLYGLTEKEARRITVPAVPSQTEVK